MNKPYKIARRSALKEYDSKWKHIQKGVRCTRNYDYEYICEFKIYIYTYKTFY